MFNPATTNSRRLISRGAAAFAASMPLSDNGMSVRMDSDPDPGDIDSVVGASEFPVQDATGLHRLSIPSLIPEDSIGLGDGMPAFEGMPG